MNRYSTQSKQRLSQCHPDLQVIFATVLVVMNHTVLTGHRGKKDQTEKFLNGQSQVQWPNSKHNSEPSMAIDAAPWPIPAKWGAGNRDEYEKFRYFAFYVLGVADVLFQIGAVPHRLRWGGDWDGDKDVTDQSFNDLVHFELEEA